MKLNILLFGGRGATSNKIPYTKKTFKEYITNELKDLKPYISKIRKSKENRYGQFGIYITGNETISPTTGRFYTYETYIPYDESKENMKFSLDLVKEELKELSRRKK